MRSKADISNHAVRVFLQEVGKFYDKARGFKSFVPSKMQKKEMLKYFNNKCCFCARPINLENMNQDHLIPMNKTSIGLHAWGNIVPCCQQCNRKKHRGAWLDYLKSISPASDLTEREAKIRNFIKKYNYNPNLHLQEITNNLYEDVGEVAETLIRLRFKQAEKIVKKVV